MKVDPPPTIPASGLTHPATDAPSPQLSSDVDLATTVLHPGADSSPDDIISPAGIVKSVTNLYFSKVETTTSGLIIGAGSTGPLETTPDESNEEIVEQNVVVTWGVVSQCRD